MCGACHANLVANGQWRPGGGAKRSGRKDRGEEGAGPLDGGQENQKNEPEFVI